MQNLMFRLSETPGATRLTGRRVGQTTNTYGEHLGLEPERSAELREEGVM